MNPLKQLLLVLACLFRGHYFPRVYRQSTNWRSPYCGRCGACMRFGGIKRFSWIVVWEGKKYIDGVEWVRADS